jgi:lysozyme
MRMSAHGRALLAQWEGTGLNAYQDSGGKWTIGVGHLLTREERDSGLVLGIPWRDGITQEQADAILEQDLLRTEDGVELAVTNLTLSQNQMDALISFTFNVGILAFATSTLCKRVNAGDLDAVPGELAKWCHVNKRVVPGLVNRRANEAALWRGEI